MSKAATAPFRAWDTEGVGAGPRHRLVALVSDQGPALARAGGISTRRALGALHRALVQDRDSLHVSFAFGYDVAMLLKDVPAPALATLWATGRMRWGPYRIDYRPRHAFGVWKRDGRKWPGGRIWDTFGFFQSSFVSALERHGVAADLLPLIRRMKERRRQFRARELPDLVAYSVAECRALVALMEDVREAALHADLPLNRWDGAGAVASALLVRQGAAQALPRGPLPRAGDPWPQAVREGARYAYFGGRIEVGQVGHQAGRVVRYDIRSAYPAVQATLPGPGGTWERVEDAAAGAVALYEVSWNAPPGRRWYPFPWRARDGAVTFPARGRGWYWAPEVAAALETLPWGSVTVHQGYVYDWYGDARPWAWIADLYQLRAEWKRAGVGAEKIVKLGLNSLYGKMAQTLGGSLDTAPRWHCLEWAGFITSATRARLYRAAVQAGPRAVAIATDGLFTTGRVRALDQDVGEGLGAWERTTYQSGTWVQSGVYWVGAGDQESAYHRGFSPASLGRADVRAAWARGRAELRVTETRFQGVGASVGSAPAYARRAQWITAPRTLALIPYAGQKRYVAVTPRALARGLHWTTPRQPLAGESWDGVGGSAPVALPWAPDGIAPPPPDPLTETEDV